MQVAHDSGQATPRILNVWPDYDYLSPCQLRQWVELFEGSPFSVTTVFLNGDPSEHINTVVGGESIVFMNVGPQPSFFQKRAMAKQLQALHRLTPFDLVLAHGALPEAVSSRLGSSDTIKIRVRHRLHEYGSVWSRLSVNNRAWPQVALSNAIASEVIQRIPSVDLMNVGTVYPVVEQHECQNQLLDRDRAREILGLEGSDFVFVNIAPLVSDSNHKILLESFANILCDHTRVKLVVIGKGPMETELKVLAKSLGIDEYVRFYSVLPDLQRLYRGFDRLVACGQCEPLSLDVLRAMAAGLPVCVTKHGGLKEAVEGVGLLLNAGDQRVLFQRMDSLLRLDSSHLASTRKAMSERLRSQFSLEAVRRQFWQLEFIKPVWKALERDGGYQIEASDEKDGAPLIATPVVAEVDTVASHHECEKVVEDDERGEAISAKKLLTSGDVG